MINQIIHVAIVEDQHDVREGMRVLINGSPNFDCHHTFANAEDAVEVIPTASVDVVLMDIGLPGMSGIEATRQLKKTNSQIQIIMLTVFEDTERIFESLSAGATGYLLKKTPPQELLDAIMTVQSGGSPMNGSIARCVVQYFQLPTPDPEMATLSPREQEVLNLLVGGLRYREIADRLFIGFETVRTHVRHIYEKLHVRSRAEATLKAMGQKRQKKTLY